MFSHATNSAQLLNSFQLTPDQIKSDKNWLLAFSGGADSMLSLYFLLQWQQLQPQEGRTLHLFYLDHGQRFSAAEQQSRAQAFEFARSLLKDSGINYREHLFKRKVTTMARRLGRTFEDAAARIRRRLCLRLARKLDADIIYGHNLSDWYETVIMRLNRGTGAAGLRAFSPCDEYFHHRELRPLCYLTRPEVRTICTQIKLSYFDDPTNDNHEFFRNQVRAELPIYNAAGLRKSASYWPHLSCTNFLKEHLHCIRPCLEYRNLKADFDLLSLDEQQRIKHEVLSLLGLYPLNNEQKRRLAHLPFFYKNHYISVENWGELYLSFHRGLSLGKIEKPPEQFSAAGLGAKEFITLPFGRKKVKKILSEKRISKRQRRYLTIKRGPSPDEITQIELSKFNLKNIEAVSFSPEDAANH